jgi:hypothetical protein
VGGNVAMWQSVDFYDVFQLLDKIQRFFTLTEKIFFLYSIRAGAGNRGAVVKNC